MNCPSCSSDNTQTIKMMCLNGTTSGRSTAVGVNTNLDIGAAVIGSKSQTALAAQFNPGPRPSGETGLGAFLLAGGGSVVLTGLPFLGEGSAGFSMFLLTSLLSTPFLVAGYNKVTGAKQKPLIEKWEQKNKLYESGWICHKCGQTWTP